MRNGHVKFWCANCGKRMLVAGEKCSKCGIKQKMHPPTDATFRDFLKTLGAQWTT
jgi:tRNA(Ile2) C34 agmatinyltransferase TiaS